MKVCTKPVMRKEKKSNPFMRKEKRREVPGHEAPVQEAPIHEAPSVGWVPVPSGDPQEGVDEEVLHEEPENRPEMIKAPLEQVQHIPEPE